MSVDFHAQQIQGFFEIPIINIETSSLFSDYYAKRFDELGVKHSDVCVVSLDYRSTNRGSDVSSEFNGASPAVVTKRRWAPNQLEVINAVGEAKDKVCLIIDGIIDAAVYVTAAHAILSKCPLDPRVKEFVTTDTIEKEHKGAVVLSVAEIYLRVYNILY